jgi:tetratricopeptide (TPR) repeat protein
MRFGIIMVILLNLAAGCSNKSGDTGVAELNSNAEMLATGLEFRSDPNNQSVAYKYLNLLVREKQYVSALTILEEMSGRYSGEEPFRKMYADIIRRAASGSGIETFDSAYYGLRDMNAEMDTLLMRINSIRNISRQITEEGPDIGLYLGRGILLLQLSDFNGAGYDFRQAFQLDSSNYLSFYYNLYLIYQQGKYSEALAFLNQHVNTVDFSAEKDRETINKMEFLLTRLTETDKNSHLDEKSKSLEKAKLLLGVKDYRQAVEQVNMAISLDENYSDAWALRALIHHEMHLHEQALADLGKAEKISGRLNSPLAKKIRNDTLSY